MASVLNLKKKIVTYTTDKSDWKWSEHTLGSIIKSPVYKDTPVRWGDKRLPLEEAVTLYQKLQDLNALSKASELKDIIWSTLDEASRLRIKKHFDLPEARIASVNKKIEEDDTIVAFYELQENYYNGEVHVAPAVYKEPCTLYRKVKLGVTKDGKYYPPGSIIEEHHTYEEDHVISTNSEITFSDYMETSPNYYWLPKAIAVAKQFGVTPNWQACEFSGRRGLGLTAHDAKELQQVANWYSGLADIDKEDLKYDWSDMIWLHHEDGVHSIQISEREYRSNPDKWLNWKETECRDFCCDLYEEELDNEDK